jgi:hypothetical protein
MTSDERVEMIRLCTSMQAERDLTRILTIAQQLNALLDRALVRKSGALVRENSED